MTMWKYAQAAVQGRSHLKSDTPCQDKTFAICQNGVYTIVLADGAGSAVLSHIGAENMTKEVGLFLCESFELLVAHEDANAARELLVSLIDDELEALTQEHNCDRKDLASTLLAVAVKGNLFFILHIGDGVIGYYDGKSIRVASNPENGEFANTTCFTTSENLKTHIRLIKGNVDSIEGFVMFSDGPEPILYRHKQQEITSSLILAFDDLKVSDPKEVEDNLSETLGAISGHVVDDCSIVMLSKSATATVSGVTDEKEQEATQSEVITPSAVELDAIGAESPEAVEESGCDQKLSEQESLNRRDCSFVRNMFCWVVLILVISVLLVLLHVL